ncbi:Phosphoglycolate phosphatase [Austwickia sp. TVS 96-490-7B]|uniref:HAD family hydrolase n=1 Tax=Austwickia sp. TVS 96-490-7B TaxID=2830843 RepID=UPI001C572750|nr:HAD hydrolase-like protein [Austwickia sp. TVS 96-490-7B]MBW3085411.1 Phosphoglycolate phosphatase [Austwickia sp. TVS 96-490-7B]
MADHNRPGDSATSIQHVVWDWNGTLFADVEISWLTINVVLTEFGLPVIPDLPTYRRTFTFPIRTYYERIGLGEETGLFEVAAHRFIEEYHSRVAGVPLRAGAIEALMEIRRRGLSQTILSASRQDLLVAQVAPFAVAQYCTAILGISDIYAHSKEDVARRWMTTLSKQGLAPQQVLFVGDTAHDVDVATTVGARVAVVAEGHLHAEVADKLGVPVLTDLREISGVLDGDMDSGHAG